jgi:hypothetical protein
MIASLRPLDGPSLVHGPLGGARPKRPCSSGYGVADAGMVHDERRADPRRLGRACHQRSIGDGALVPFCRASLSEWRAALRCGRPMERSSASGRSPDGRLAACSFISPRPRDRSPRRIWPTTSGELRGQPPGRWGSEPSSARFARHFPAPAYHPRSPVAMGRTSCDFPPTRGWTSSSPPKQSIVPRPLSVIGTSPARAAGHSLHGPSPLVRSCLARRPNGSTISGRARGRSAPLPRMSW